VLIPFALLDRITKVQTLTWNKASHLEVKTEVRMKLSKETSTHYLKINLGSNPTPQKYRLLFSEMDGLFLTFTQSADQIREKTARKMERRHGVLSHRIHEVYSNQIRYGCKD